MPSFVKLYRSKEIQDFIIQHPSEFILLTFIALRARWSDTKVAGLEKGEALIGDYKKMGLTRQVYRTALKNLKKWNFLTTKVTTKGTIAKLVDTTYYDLGLNIPNHQTNQQLTSNQPAANQQLTTNIERRKKKEESSTPENFENLEHLVEVGKYVINSPPPNLTVPYNQWCLAVSKAYGIIRDKYLPRGDAVKTTALRSLALKVLTDEDVIAESKTVIMSPPTLSESPY